MLFKSLMPLIAERPVHILVSTTKDGRIKLYVEPKKKDEKEDATFCSPFQCEGTAEEMDADLPGVLSQWVQTRSSVTTSLAESLAKAEADLKDKAESAKKTATKGAGKGTAKTTPAKTVPTPTKVSAGTAEPSLLDDATPAETATEKAADAETLAQTDDVESAEKTAATSSEAGKSEAATPTATDTVAAATEPAKLVVAAPVAATATGSLFDDE